MQFFLRMIQQAFIDMENMYDLLNEKQEVSCICFSADCIISLELSTLNCDYLNVSGWHTIQRFLNPSILRSLNNSFEFDALICYFLHLMQLLDMLQMVYLLLIRRYLYIIYTLILVWYLLRAFVTSFSLGERCSQCTWNDGYKGSHRVQ